MTSQVLKALNGTLNESEQQLSLLPQAVTLAESHQNTINGASSGGHGAR
jgi:hypothetical protein